jgi:orotidine-5'-phosphate decarboxylase
MTWIPKEEQLEVVEKMVQFGIIKVSNERNLPLKNGGFTDIYISIRDARNYAEATKFLAKLYMRELLRINPNLFVEVPDAVSGIAGCLSVISSTPYITIREQEKERRVSDSKIIGNISPNDSVIILDDVITDGASKIIPYNECIKRGAKCLGLLVLVDRQQGWKEKFNEANIDIPVYAGMTLHDVRKCLFELGYLKRCAKEVEENNPIIVALDNKNMEEIIQIVDPMRTSGCILKFNDFAFEKGFEKIFEEFSIYGRIMLDLKLHDISNTILNTLERIKQYPNHPWAITIHASVGKKTLTKAVECLKDTNIKLLAITVLTDISDDCEEIYGRSAKEQVMAMTKMAYEAGVRGFVCSAEEVREIRKAYPDATLVTPGIRSEEKPKDDQVRTGTPSQAINDGSDHIVMGRQILNSSDPIAEIAKVLKEIGR